MPGFFFFFLNQKIWPTRFLFFQGHKSCCPSWVKSQLSSSSAGPSPRGLCWSLVPASPLLCITRPIQWFLKSYVNLQIHHSVGKKKKKLWKKIYRFCSAQVWMPYVNWFLSSAWRAFRGRKRSLRRAPGDRWRVGGMGEEDGACDERGICDELRMSAAPL